MCQIVICVWHRWFERELTLEDGFKPAMTRSLPWNLSSTFDGLLIPYPAIIHQMAGLRIQGNE